jgi:hypothetical protein
MKHSLFGKVKLNSIAMNYLNIQIKLFLFIIFSVFFLNLTAQKKIKIDNNRLTLDRWTFIQADSTRGKWGDYDERPSMKSMKYYGLAMKDVTGDGFKDVVSGRYFYRNPGGDMTGSWARIDLGINVDGMLFMDSVDNDNYGNIIAEASPDVYWFKAQDRQGNVWKGTKIAKIPNPGVHANGQGFTMAKIVKNSKRPQILLSSSDGIYCIEVPDKNPEGGNWKTYRIAPLATEEGISTADIDGDGNIDIAAGYVPKEGIKESDVATYVGWWRNPGDGSGDWKLTHVGSTKFFCDRVKVADINGDKKSDIIVSEERWPETDEASVYWFEQPLTKGGQWNRHTIVTQYTTNSLDVTDMDNDGDNDIITCEHRGTKKLSIWENNGKGNFTEHVVSIGKEGHLGAQVADLDNDGDMEILNIAWDSYPYLYIWRNDAIQNGVINHPVFNKVAAGRKYSIPLEINAGGYERFNKPVEVEINFTTLLNKLNEKGNFDENSILIAETDGSGKTIDNNVVFQFDKDSAFNSKSNAKGILTLLLKAGSQPNSSRHFIVKFGPAGVKYEQHVFPSMVNITENLLYAGYDSYKIATLTGTYYYHKKGSGFASLIDIEKNDWISYHPDKGSRAAGEFRGVPNTGSPDFHPGAGDDNLESKILSKGPLKITIYSETKDQKSACKWDIFPEYARMTMLKCDPQKPYWLMYEGTPGGRLDTIKGFWMNSKGDKMPCSKIWNGQLPNPKWAYFSSGYRIFYMMYEAKEYTGEDEYHPMENNMTVFGFGRRFPTRYLTQAPAALTIGLVPCLDFNSAKHYINAAYQPVSIKMGIPK